MELSILIPARSEEFLARTIQDLLENTNAETEIIAVLDGEWANPPIPQHERVNIIYVPESIGQRAATNLACKLSKAKYIMKADSHCAFDKGFDVKMIEAFKEEGDNVVIAPGMRNLWVYDWKCPKCGKKVYQDKVNICPPSERHSEPVTMVKKMLWIAKTNPFSTAYCFDPEPHFQYDGNQKKRQKETKGNLVETMSLQGSCWMVTREKYWELNLGDENFGSWGSQGIQVACSFWLSGGKVLVNRATWYAHCFRTKSDVFGFPYPISGRQVQNAKKYARNLLYENKFPKQILPSSWLVEKFWPVPGWSDDDLKKLKKEERKL